MGIPTEERYVTQHRPAEVEKREQRREGRRSGMQGRLEGSGGGRGAEGGVGVEGAHSFILIHLLPLQLLLFAALKLDGGCTVGHSAGRYSEQRGCAGSPACHSR